MVRFKRGGSVKWFQTLRHLLTAVSPQLVMESHEGGSVLGDWKEVFLWATRAWQCQWDGEAFWLEPVAHISCYSKHPIKSAVFLINNLKISDVAKKKKHPERTGTVLFLEAAENRTSFSWKHYTSRREVAPLQCLSFLRHCSHSLKQCWPMEIHVPMFVGAWASQLSQEYSVYLSPK